MEQKGKLSWRDIIANGTSVHSFRFTCLLRPRINDNAAHIVTPTCVCLYLQIYFFIFLTVRKSRDDSSSRSFHHGTCRSRRKRGVIRSHRTIEQRFQSTETQFQPSKEFAMFNFWHHCLPFLIVGGIYLLCEKFSRWAISTYVCMFRFMFGPQLYRECSPTQLLLFFDVY